MLKKILQGTAFVMIVGFGTATAEAAATTYSGQDDGAAIGGPYTNSVATEASFLSSATGYGPVTTETFDSIPYGTAAGGGTFAITGASVSITTPYGDPYGGISQSVSNEVYGFPISGKQWLAFDGGSATFTFSSPTDSFGFYTTGVQTVFTSTFTVTYNGADGQTFNIPINVNGGASYFGFTDAAGFTSVTITNTSDDAWGIDNLSYNAAVPEPAMWAMFLIGFGGLGLMMRGARRTGVVAAA